MNDLVQNLYDFSSKIFSTEVLLGILIVCCLLLAIFLIRIELRMRKFMNGKDGQTLEHFISKIKEDLINEQVFKKEMENYLTQVEKRLIRGTRALETVRFNAFKGTGSGGNQSFATTIVNERGDGVVISSLNARDKTSIFAKPLKRWKSEFELTPEEKESLELAKQSIQG